MTRASRADILLFVALVVASLIYVLRPEMVVPPQDCGVSSGPPRLVAAYGDSTTQGWDRTHNMPYYLAPLLCHTLVTNEGVSGTRADQLLAGTDARHPPWKEEMARSTADVVLLNFGINDRRMGTPRDHYIASMRELVRVAKAKGKQVVLQTPNPIFLTPDQDTPDTDLQHFAEGVRQLAASEQVPLIDVNRWMLETLKTHSVRELYADALHPRSPTYGLIAAETAQTLRALH